MAKQLINIGTAPNDGTGDPLRTVFGNIKSNFDELYALPGGVGNLFFVNTAVDPFNADVGHRAATVRFQGYDGTEQFRIDTTPSAVSYLIARGGIAGSMPVIVPGGAAADIPLSLSAKGLEGLYFGNGAGTHLAMDDLGNGPTANWLLFSGNISGSAPNLSAAGGDTNIDISLTPKGAGKLRYGTHTAASINLTADMTSLGSVAIKDAGGTSRKLAVGA